MISVRRPELAKQIVDPRIRSLVEQRFNEILAGEKFNEDTHGFMLVAEPGDTVEALEKEAGVPILNDFFGEFRYGDPDFAPCFEALEEHTYCYEILVILDDEGYAVDIIVPKTEGVDILLLAFCANYAVRSPEPTHP